MRPPRTGDEQVRAIIEGRRRSRTDVVAELRRMADDDPIAGNERQLGHLYLLAQPEAASEEIFLNLLARNDTMQVLQEMTREIARDRGSGTTGYEPDIPWLQHRIPRAEGMAITSYSPEDGPPREQSLLELVIREDGGIRLICGRGTDAFPRAGILLEERPPMAIITMLVLGLTHCVWGARNLPGL